MQERRRSGDSAESAAESCADEAASGGEAARHEQQHQKRVVAQQIAKLVCNYVCHSLLSLPQTPSEQPGAGPAPRQQRRAEQEEGGCTWLDPGGGDGWQHWIRIGFELDSNRFQIGFK